MKINEDSNRAENIFDNPFNAGYTSFAVLFKTISFYLNNVFKIRHEQTLSSVYDL